MLMSDVVKPSLGAQWPDAIEVANVDGSSPITLICEHASNHIPAEYACLGLDAAELQRHIAWDIGAAAVTRALSQLLDAPAFLGTYSRLLVDLNRPPGSPTSIVNRSESTDIPGNLALSPAERERRVQHIFKPFHDRIASHLEGRERSGVRNAVVSIHSFTPVYFGDRRPWHAGILFEKASSFAHAVIENLGSDSSFNIGANVPYAVAADEDYALLVHGDAHGYPAILVEIRNDQIADAAGVQEWARRIATAIGAAQASQDLFIT